MPAPATDSGIRSRAHQLRHALRRARRNLPRRAQRDHARRVACLLMRLPEIARARTIATYVANDGELDPQPIRDRLQRRRWYLPVIESIRPPRMRLHRDRDPRRRRPNAFGIPEPIRKHSSPVQPLALDLVLVPLVGFDAAGHRLGMGLGFYDRTFAFPRAHRGWRRPRLIGLAHECQRLNALTPQPWDLSLDAVVTEARIYRPRAAAPDVHKSLPAR